MDVKCANTISSDFLSFSLGLNQEFIDVELIEDKGKKPLDSDYNKVLAQHKSGVKVKEELFEQ